MNRLIAFVFSAVVAASVHADEPYHLGDVDDTAYYILVNKDAAPSVNKNGVVVAHVVGIHGETRNGHIAGGADRVVYAIDCGQQMYKAARIWAKRSEKAEIVWRDENDVIAELNGMMYTAIRADSLGASVADFACEFVAQSSKPSAPADTAPPVRDRTGKPIEYVPL